MKRPREVVAASAGVLKIGGTSLRIQRNAGRARRRRNRPRRPRETRAVRPACSAPTVPTQSCIRSLARAESSAPARIVRRRHSVVAVGISIRNGCRRGLQPRSCRPGRVSRPRTLHADRRRRCTSPRGPRSPGRPRRAAADASRAAGPNALRSAAFRRFAPARHGRGRSGCHSRLRGTFGKWSSERCRRRGGSMRVCGLAHGS